ncbi:phosphatase PAP2 family protein [Actinomycetospora termitidis]|uniref:Phosphatase PAP2 family protein n=1 Tax=Actinomycetospora termitidis TaxID=3053470 RepID=A0ABT7M5D0_9PSEU|nr:phosphatase PAP2 family protein [Actinomycetospora sp. Odt1-22]MDL5155247.1 phosphatase PAP2 family protein [Actinomycetospora sp. Odt1-22]
MTTAIGLAVVAVLLLGGAVYARARTPRPVPRCLVVAGVLVGLSAVVFGLVAQDETLAATDGPVLGFLLTQRTPGRTDLAEAASLFGGTFFTGGLAVLAALVLALRGRRSRAVVWVGAVLVGSITIRLLKTAVERSRPPLDARLAVETSASLPSGHALMASLGVGLTVVAVLVLLRDSSVRGPVVREAIVLVGALIVLLIGTSRAYLGVHWTTDVLAGWMLGTALLALAVALATVLERRPAEIDPSKGSVDAAVS